MPQDAAFNPVAAAEAILPVLAEHSAESDLQRHVHPASLKAVCETGLSRVLTPKRFGGMELSPPAHIRSCITLAHGCSAAAWVHMVCRARTYVVGRYPEQCQQEVFGETPDVLIPGTLAPQGQARKTDGGWPAQRALAIRQRRRSRPLDAAGCDGRRHRRQAHRCDPCGGTCSRYNQYVTSGGLD